MNREEKAELIKKLNSTFNNAGVVVVTHQSGLTVEESTDLRVKMREVGARYQVDFLPPAGTVETEKHLLTEAK